MITINGSALKHGSSLLPSYCTRLVSNAFAVQFTHIPWPRPEPNAEESVNPLISYGWLP